MILLLFFKNSRKSVFILGILFRDAFRIQYRPRVCKRECVSERELECVRLDVLLCVFKCARTSVCFLHTRVYIYMYMYVYMLYMYIYRSVGMYVYYAYIYVHVHRRRYMCLSMCVLVKHMRV